MDSCWLMQKLLYHYGRTAEPQEEASSGHGNVLFAALSQDVQALVQPYLDSRYTVTGLPQLNMAVYFTSGIPFWRWLHSWLRQLVENFASGQPYCKRTLSLSLRWIFTARYEAVLVVQAICSHSSRHAAW